MKVKRVTHRGTSIRDAELEDMNWSGDSYRAVQKSRFAKIPRDYVLHIGRGSRTTKAKDLPGPAPRPSTYGMTRVTNRGTSSRKSRNRGTVNPKK